MPAVTLAGAVRALSNGRTAKIAEHDITAVPVVDDQGRPIGVVSEADLLRKQESQADPGGHLAAAHLLPAERAKAHALTAEGLTRRSARRS
ncbi:hypothetical protein SSP24_80890 [Streptomyces spinoverrucosus]|uniref:CBS domain-containing protein n=1 Tax=Streptomyces spinoverrucosus TaxID=284043 RepID=A0A4Y3VTW7_9ACTN|nr:hypothetical protein SSP24_80890 [Streptomyces spinoverrucosus]GHB48830.1 hypothetical protein GCM10010397_18150 [Streptomyces spinoverrucosus]